LKEHMGGKLNYSYIHTHMYIYKYYNTIEKHREREDGNVRVVDNFFFFVRKIKLNKLECMCIRRVFK
jgi:hypothetical protein